MAFPATNIVPPHMETKKALLIVDLQNDFVSSDGKLYVENTAEFLPKIPALVAKFREIGQVVWARTEFVTSRPTISQSSGTYVAVLKEFLAERDADGQSQQQDRIEPDRPEDPQPTPHISAEPPAPPAPPKHDPEAFLTLSPSTSTSHELQPCLPFTSGSEPPPLLATATNHQQDMTITKSYYSALEGTALLEQLRTTLVTDVYILGSLSNVSIYATVLDCSRHGLNVTIIEDCVGYRDERCHVEAMRQMVDGMGANGIDYQELMDEMFGLLGDVVKMEEFTRSHAVSFQRSGIKRKQRTAPAPAPVMGVEARTTTTTTPARHVSLPPELEVRSTTTVGAYRRQSPQPRPNAESLRASPPRKRSHGPPDDEGDDEHRRKVQQQQQPSIRRASEEPYGENSSSKGKSSSRPRSRRKKEYRDAGKASSSTPAASASMSTSTTRPSGQHVKSTGDIPDRPPALDGAATPDATTHHVEAATQHHVEAGITRLRKIRDQRLPPLGPDSIIGTGDSRIIYSALPTLDVSESAFTEMKNSLPWSTMNHRSGPVPRLVCVLGSIADNSIVPIYRHPADSSPPLSPFSQPVLDIKTALEEIVGHELNHALVQLYRSSEDNISEHADKTLDILQGSIIVNYSLGAERVMTLRSKRAHHASGGGRITQRVPLPHNSVFLLGPDTNREFLHSIRADKRPRAQKSEAELAYGGERISFTFRQIGTWIDAERNLIWGQGARGKTRETASTIPAAGTELAKREWEEMIDAFGRENHSSSSMGRDGGESWSWEETYGRGFDVVDSGVQGQVLLDGQTRPGEEKVGVEAVAETQMPTEAVAVTGTETASGSQGIASV